MPLVDHSLAEPLEVMPLLEGLDDPKERVRFPQGGISTDGENLAFVALPAAFALGRAEVPLYLLRVHHSAKFPHLSGWAKLACHYDRLMRVRVEFGQAEVFIVLCPCGKGGMTQFSAH